MKKIKLHHKVQSAIVKDYQKWSNGCTPAESSDEEIQNYLEGAIPAKYKTPAVIDWLGSLNKISATKPSKPAELTPDQKFLAKRESELHLKYPHLVPGTLRRGEGHHKGKLVCEVACTTEGCKKHRGPVATSDLWQVKLCADHAKEAKSARRKVKAT